MNLQIYITGKALSLIVQENKVLLDPQSSEKIVAMFSENTALSEGLLVYEKLKTHFGERMSYMVLKCGDIPIIDTPAIIINTQDDNSMLQTPNCVNIVLMNTTPPFCTNYSTRYNTIYVENTDSMNHIIAILNLPFSSIR